MNRRDRSESCFLCKPSRLACMKISFSAIRQFAITQTGSKSNDIHCIFAGIGDIAPTPSVVDPQVATLALAQMLQGLPQGRDARLRFRVIRAALSGSGFQQCGRDAGRSGVNPTINSLGIRGIGYGRELPARTSPTSGRPLTPILFRFPLYPARSAFSKRAGV